MKENENRLSSNQISAMKRDILEPSYRGSKKILDSGWNRIPAVGRFTIELSEKNALLETVGLSRRLKNLIIVEKTKYDRMNRYMAYQIQRAKNRPDLRWVICKATIKRSVSFRTSAFTRVFPQWWCEMHIKQVIGLLKKVDDIIKTSDDSLIFSRTYIEKKGGWRPLGVPKGEWRVVMHMWNNWITLFTKHLVSDWNHGFIPKKGCNTAWKEILTKVLKKRYIYEFDLKDFFGQVSIPEVTRILMEEGMPKGDVYWLENINRCLPILTDEDKIDETSTRKRYELISKLKSGENIATEGFIDMQQIAEIGPIIYDLMREDGYDNLHEYVQAQWVALDSISPHGFHEILKGLPQGLNTSPILSILTLASWVKKMKAEGVDVIMYADDGLMFSDRPFVPKGTSEIQLHEKKSGWIKRQSWEKNIKFLGIEYDYKTKLIKGNTRKGSRLEFDSERKEVFDLLKELKGEYSKENMEDLASSNLMGLVMNKLYNGTWEEKYYTWKRWKLHEKSIFSNTARILGLKGRSSITSSMFVATLSSIVKNSIAKGK